MVAAAASVYSDTPDTQTLTHAHRNDSHNSRTSTSRWREKEYRLLSQARLCCFSNNAFFNIKSQFRQRVLSLKKNLAIRFYERDSWGGKEKKLKKKHSIVYRYCSREPHDSPRSSFGYMVNRRGGEFSNDSRANSPLCP